MEMIVPEAFGGQVFHVRRGARAAEEAGGAKAGVVNQDEPNVWRSRRRPQLHDRRILVPEKIYEWLRGRKVVTACFGQTQRNFLEICDQTGLALLRKGKP
jgi:hypothetical protein